jgi:hypothetical protein
MAASPKKLTAVSSSKWIVKNLSSWEKTVLRQWLYSVTVVQEFFLPD